MAPLIPRDRRFTVSARLAADGSEVTPVDRDEARRVAERIGDTGAQSVAIAFINSYRDGRHEVAMRDILAEELPDVAIAISSETRPKVRELGRFVTTAVRAALLPVVGDYMSRLEARLTEAGCRAGLFIVKSNGGMMRSTTAKARPEELIASGPAGGVAAGSRLGALLGEQQVIVTDVGGTSFEASLLEDGEGLVTDEFEIEWERPVVTPMLDIRSIGAGGGSIAWLDDGGSLRVGPQSAGADPGPACYGLGGAQPTVTDANLVLGRIDPTLGGKMELDVEAARGAVATVAEPLGLDVLACAEGITQIVSEHMAAAIRMVSSDRGRDPRDHVVVAFGGAGGLHAQQIARAAGVERVVVPSYAGVACAFGAITMDVRHDVEATYFAPTADIDLADLGGAYSELERRATELLEADGIAGDDAELVRSAQMRYVGQSYEVDTPVPSGALDAHALERIEGDFNEVHKREYGVSGDFPVSFVTLRVTGIGRTLAIEDSDMADASRTAPDGSSVRAHRDAFFEGGWQAVEVHDATLLRSGQRIDGPAIIEQPDGVVVVPGGSEAAVDQYQNIIITDHEESRA